MPVLWQSSQRPMYIRTVWVDGFRHAILSHDDPQYLKIIAKRRRPHSSASTFNNPSKRSTRCVSELQHPLKKFNFVVRNDKSFQRPRDNHPDIEKLDLSNVDSDEELTIKPTPHPRYESDSNRSQYNSLNMRSLKSNRTARPEVKESNELSERVLQWLDLAGKIDLLAPENVERMSQPRHSWPEIQRRNYNLMKSKTSVDVRVKEIAKTPSQKPIDSAKTVQSGVIDRHEYHEPTSANTIENYARQSRNVKSKHDTTKTRDKTKGKDVRNIMETRQKVASERSAVEKQYAELVSKNLIPELKTNKKQVHIFMPDLPKKGSNNASRSESLLSQFSQLTKKTK